MKNLPSSYQVPIIVAATSPFINIVFDEGDKLNATLDQINNGTYDRLKFCRMTMSLNGEISILNERNLAVLLTYSGAFIFPKIKGLEKQDIIDCANRLIMQLMMGGIVLNAISPDDIGHGIINNNGYFKLTGATKGENLNFLFSLQQKFTDSLNITKILNPQSYTKTEITKAINDGKAHISHLNDINPSIFINAITYYKQYQLQSSLIFTWSTIETLLETIWKNKITPNGAGIHKRKDFVEGQAWSAAHKSEVLFQTGVIGNSLYNKLNEAREARNKIAHKCHTPSIKICETAINGMFSLMSLIVSNYTEDNLFNGLYDKISSTHLPAPTTHKQEDLLCWREMLPIPGDSEWGDTPYPKHKEIELIPIDRKGGTDK